MQPLFSRQTLAVTFFRAAQTLAASGSRHPESSSKLNLCRCYSLHIIVDLGEPRLLISRVSTLEQYLSAPVSESLGHIIPPFNTES